MDRRAFVVGAAVLPVAAIAQRGASCEPDVGAQQACEQFVMLASAEARCQSIDPLQYTLTMLGVVMRQS